MLPLPNVSDYNGYTGSVGPMDSVLGQQLFRKLGVLRCTYKVTRDGGAVGTYSFLNDDDSSAAQLPIGAVVLDAVLNVSTAPVGAGASIAIQLQAANDVVTATAITSAPWSSTGLKQGIPVWSTIANAVSVSSTAKTLSAVVSGATLTAGVIQAFLFYVLTA